MCIPLPNRCPRYIQYQGILDTHTTHTHTDVHSYCTIEDKSILYVHQILQVMGYLLTKKQTI